MTRYAWTRKGGHTRSCSMSALRSGMARSQESPGDRRFSEICQVVPWLEERVKSVGS